MHLCETSLFIWLKHRHYNVSQVALLVNNSSTNIRDSGDVGSIPGLGRFHAGINGNPFQYSCLENSTDKGAWQPIIHGVTESQIQLNHYA